MKYLLTIVLIICAMVAATAQSTNNTYDSKNQINQVDWGNGTTIQYNHDQVGNRVNKVVATTVVNQSDLVVQNPGLSATSVVPGGVITANATAANTGTANAGVHHLRLYLSANTTYEQPIDTELAFRYLNGLAQGANSVQSNISITVPLGTAPGTWYVLFYIDANGAVTESNETNNIAFLQITVIDCSALVLSSDDYDATCGLSNGYAAVNISGGSGSYSFLWNTIPPQTTATASNLAAGSYTITVTDNTTGCIKSTTVQVNSTGQSPTASFTSSVAGNVVQFSNASVNGTSYSWDLGDGNTSTSTAPNHTYAAAGTYYACLTATNSCGSNQYCVNVITTGSQQGCNLQVAITASSTQLCTGSTNTLSVPTGFVSYSWTGGGQGNQITVSMAGNYSVTVTDAAQCTATDDITITSAGGSPTASFTSSVSGNTVSFTNTSQNATGYSWDFGDGNTSTDTDPSHTYAANGSYTICLSAQNGCGSSNFCETVQVGGIIPTSVSVAGDVVSITYPPSLGTITNLTNQSVKLIGEATGYKSGTLVQQGNVLNFTSASAIVPGEVLHLIIPIGMATSSNALAAYSKIIYAPAGIVSCGAFDTLSTGLKFPSTVYSYSLDVADFDRNGTMDIVGHYYTSYGAATNLVVHLRNPNGTYQAALTYSNSSSHSGLAGTPDLNNDGYPDIVVRHNLPSSIAVWLNNGNGTFASSPVIHSVSNYNNGVRFADMNNDGFIDIIGYSGISSLVSNRISVLLNNGNGTFATQVTYTTSSTFGGGLVSLDINKDGWQDLAYSSTNNYSSSPTVQLFTNNGAGVIGNTLNQQNPDLLTALGASDFNGDGNDDLLLTGPNYSQVRYGDGLGNFSSTLNVDSFYTYHTGIGDVNGDGLYDMVVKMRYEGTTWGGTPYALHKNNGNGTFTKIYGTIAYAKTVSPKTSDINYDGAIDYAYIGHNDSIYFALNRTNPTVGITTGANPICLGETTTISADPGFVTYSWSNGGSASSISATQSGIYTVQAVDANGCSATASTQLVVNQTFNTNLVQVICSGQSFGGYSATGTYTDVFTANNGCDSTRTLDLTVMPAITSTITQSICNGQSFEGYSATGTYTDVFTAQNGCDSTRTLDLTVLPAIASSVTQSICNGQSFEGYSSTGVYTDTFTAQNGCDSTRTLDLTVLPAITSSVTQSICNGQSFEGYSATGVYTDTFTAQSGCDSTRTLDLTVLPAVSSSITEEICAGESFLGYTTDGQHSDVFVAASGCDSTRVLNLIVHDLPFAPTISDMSGYLESSEAVGNQWYLNGQLMQGETGQTLNNPVPGTYTVEHTDANGCTSTSAPFDVLVTGIAALNNETGFEVFPNPNSGTFTVRVSTTDALTLKLMDAVGKTVTTRNVANSSGTVSEDFTGIASGVYLLEATTDGQRYVQRVVVN